MSITAVNETGPPMSVWGVWLAAAVVMAVLFAWRRPKKTPAVADPVAEQAESLQIVPLLAAAGLVSFCVWVAVQMIYVMVRPPATVEATTTMPASLTWPAADRAALSLLPNLCGYAVGLALLILGGGVATIGYGVRRIPNGLLGGTIGVFIAMPVVYFALRATEWTLTQFDIDHSKKHDLLRVLADEPGVTVRVVAALAAVVAAPLFEELLFRGCIQGGLRRATGSPLVGVVVASTLFASIHLAWTIPPIFVLSLLLGVVYERTRNLWAVTVMHALFNLFSVLTTGAN